MWKPINVNASQLQAVEGALDTLSHEVQSLGHSLAACDKAKTPLQKFQCVGSTLERGIIPGIHQVTTYIGDVYYGLGMDSITGYKAQACPSESESGGHGRHHSKSRDNTEEDDPRSGFIIPSSSAQRLEENLRTNMNSALKEFQDVVDIIQTCAHEHNGNTELEAGQRLVCYKHKGLFPPLARGLSGMLQNVNEGLSALATSTSEEDKAGSSASDSADSSDSAGTN